MQGYVLQPCKCRSISAPREPWQSGAGGAPGPGRRTDRQTLLGQLRSCGCWAQRELPGPYGSASWWQMTQRSLEHLRAAGARIGLGGRSRAGRGSQAQRWVLNGEKKKKKKQFCNTNNNRNPKK